MIFAAIAIAAIACGSGDEKESSDGNAGSTSTDSSSGGDNSLFGGFGGDGTCSALTGIAGIPGAALSTSASTSPNSDFAKETSDFFENLIEDALSLAATTSCFFEISDDEEAGVWIAFDLSEPVSSNASGLLTQALSDQGISADGSAAFSANTGQGSFSGIGFDSLPGINVAAGGMIMLSGSSAFVAAGTDFSDGGTTGASQPPITEPSSSGSGNSGATGGVSVPSGAVGDVSDALKSALESTLGVSLQLDGTFSASEGGTTSVILTYSTSPSLSGDSTDSLTDVVTGFGGNVDFSFSGGGAASLNFSDATIGGYSVDGILTASEGLTASLQVSQ